MTSFVQKLRVVTLGTVHDLLDRAIDLNSPSALRQYTRDLEDALDKMRNEAAVQAGQVRTFEREKGDLENKIAVGKQTITKLQETGHPDLARIKATEIVAAQSQLEKTTTDLAGQQKASADIDLALSKVEAKHAEMVNRVRELERLDRDTKSKEQTAGALAAAGRLVSGGADMSIDDVESRMRQRNDVASEKFSRAMGDVSVQEDPETAAAVDNLMSQLAPEKKETAKA